jgi:anti-anti-sigma factor
MGEFSIATSTRSHSTGGRETVFTPRGGLDAAAGGVLGAEMAAAAAGGRAVALDVSRLRGGDLGGWRSLLEAMDRGGVDPGVVEFRNDCQVAGGAVFSRTMLSGGVVLASIAGDLDRRGADAVGECLATLCGVRGGRVLLDLSGVGMIVSLGVGLLISGMKSVVAGGGRMFFLNPSPIVATSLEFSGLERYVFHGTVEAAAARIGGE